jgi:hypothetical protein
MIGETDSLACIPQLPLAYGIPLVPNILHDKAG